MTQKETTPQLRTYVQRNMLIMGSYIGVNLAAIFGLFDTLNRAGNWVISIGCGMLIAAQIWSTLMLIEKSDEYVRAFLVRQYVTASGLSMAIFSTWGFAESYANAPHAPGWLIFALFWACFGVSAPILAMVRK